jgi:hypothetical protein
MKDMVTAMMNSDQIDSFNARVQRIQNPRNTFYVDPETGMKVPKRVSKKLIKRSSKMAQCKPGMMSLMMGVILGGLCLMVARFASQEIIGSPVADDLTLGLELAAASIIAFIVGGFVSQKSFRHMVAQVAGAAFMAVAMHNLIWMFPDEFAMVYSQSYVDQIRAVTTPNSLYLRGETYTI